MPNGAARAATTMAAISCPNARVRKVAPRASAISSGEAKLEIEYVTARHAKIRANSPASPHFSP